MSSKKKEAKEIAINRFKNEALEFEQNQQWKRAAIRWEHCSKLVQDNKYKGLFLYSSFFCYRLAEDIPKAMVMIEKCRKKYLLLGDYTTSAFCEKELEILNAEAIKPI